MSWFSDGERSDGFTAAEVEENKKAVERLDGEIAQAEAALVAAREMHALLAAASDRMLTDAETLALAARGAKAARGLVPVSMFLMGLREWVTGRIALGLTNDDPLGLELAKQFGIRVVDGEVYVPQEIADQMRSFLRGTRRTGRTEPKVKDPFKKGVE